MSQENKVGKTNAIVEKLKDNALSIQQLKDLVGPNQAERCKWLVYDDIPKFKRIDELMDLGAVVVLLQIETPRAPKVGHFVVLLDHGSHYEHFDSYGLTMDEELKITDEHHLTNIFRTSMKPIIDNHKRLQTLREDINTCGRWVVARLLLRKLELDAFLKLLAYFRVNYDDLVSLMTLLLQFKN